MQLYENENDSNIKMVKIGDFQLTLQSFIVLVFGLVYVALVVAITFNVLPPVMLVMFAIILTLSFSISAYNVHCVQVGKCYTWSWILTFGMGIIIALFIVNVFTMKNGGPIKGLGKRKLTK